MILGLGLGLGLGVGLGLGLGLGLGIGVGVDLGLDLGVDLNNTCVKNMIRANQDHEPVPPLSKHEIADWLFNLAPTDLGRVEVMRDLLYWATVPRHHRDDMLDSDRAIITLELTKLLTTLGSTGDLGLKPKPIRADKVRSSGCPLCGTPTSSGVCEECAPDEDEDKYKPLVKRLLTLDKLKRRIIGTTQKTRGVQNDNQVEVE